MPIELIEKIAILAVNTFCLFLVIVVLSNSSSRKLNLWFVIMTICIAGWVDFAYLGISVDSTNDAANFYRINSAFVSAFIFSAYVFLMECVLEKKSIVTRAIILLISIAFACLAFFTNLIVAGVQVKDWGNEMIFGDLNPIFSIYAAIIASVFLYNFTRSYFVFTDSKKEEMKYFLIGTFLLVFFNILFNVLAPIFIGTIRLQNWGDYSAVIFLAFTAYSVVRYRFLGTKVVLTAFLISTIGSLLIVDIFLLSNTLIEQGMKAVILLFFAVISTMVIRSVLNEIRQRELLNQLAQQQKDIIDIMGHEIRTPLTVIIHELDLHETVTYPKRADYEKKIGKEDTDLIMDSFQSMSVASSQAVAVVNDMLETARLDKQRFELNYKEFDLVEAVKTCIDLSKKVTAQSPVTYTAKLPEKLEVTADKVRIKEAVDALLSNAVKYGKSDEAGTVDIAVEVKSENDHVDISVTDKGIGIAQEDIEKLGKKFVRLDPKTENFVRPGGTGLGLFVVNGVAERHGGKLIITSEGVNKGSTFTIRLPLKPSPDKIKQISDSTHN
jgi:signal transduction histidine kinase